MKKLFSLLAFAAIISLVSCKKNPPVVVNPCSTDSVAHISGTVANGPIRYSNNPMSDLYTVYIDMNYVNIGPDGTIAVTVTTANGSVYVYPKSAPHTGAAIGMVSWFQTYSSVAYPLRVTLKGKAGVVGCLTELPYGQLIIFAQPAP